MRILKDPNNTHQIIVYNYQITATEANSLKIVGIVQNVAVGNSLYAVINCGRAVTDVDVVAVKRVLEKQ